MRKEGGSVEGLRMVQYRITKKTASLLCLLSALERSEEARYGHAKKDGKKIRGSRRY
jgi:hypothetical protein